MKFQNLISGGLILSTILMVHPTRADSSSPTNSAPVVYATLDEISEHNRLVGIEIDASMALSKLGNAAAVTGDWTQAKDYYQQAFAKWATNGEANLGMARYSHVVGDSAAELKYYRAFIYRGEPGEANFQTCDTAKMMYYAQILDKSGQTAEAKAVYNHATSLLKYMDGKPSYGYMMPLFGTGLGEIPYTSARLQAMVQVGMGIHSLDTQELTVPERLAHLNEAVRLYPDSPVVYAYLSRQYELMKDPREKAAFARANALGFQQISSLLDAQTAQMQQDRAMAGK